MDYINLPCNNSETSTSYRADSKYEVQMQANNQHSLWPQLNITCAQKIQFLFYSDYKVSLNVLSLFKQHTFAILPLLAHTVLSMLYCCF